MDDAPAPPTAPITPPATPAGWYPDAHGTSRYWDGAQWTDHITPAPIGATTTQPRNGLGLAALILGIVGALFGIIPFTFFIAGTLGVIGLILGLVGWSRTRKGIATNQAVSIVGVILSIVAIALAVWGAVVLFSATKDLVDALNGGVSTPGVSESCPGTSYPDQQTSDVCADGNGVVALAGITTSASPLTRTTGTFGTAICTTLTLQNTTQETQSYNEFNYRLMYPAGEVKDIQISDVTPLNSGDLVIGGSTSGTVCFPDSPGATGQFALIYKPDAFNAARGIWLAPVQ